MKRNSRGVKGMSGLYFIFPIVLISGRDGQSLPSVQHSKEGLSRSHLLKACAEPQLVAEPSVWIKSILVRPRTVGEGTGSIQGNILNKVLYGGVGPTLRPSL